MQASNTTLVYSLLLAGIYCVPLEFHHASYSYLLYYCLQNTTRQRIFWSSSYNIIIIATLYIVVIHAW